MAVLRGISSVGRAFGWQPKGHRFEPGILHYIGPGKVAFFKGNAREVKMESNGLLS